MVSNQDDGAHTVAEILSTLYIYIMGVWLMLYDHLAVESLVKVWWEKRHNLLLCLSDLDSQTGHKKENFYSLEVVFLSQKMMPKTRLIFCNMWHWFSHWIIKQLFLRCFSDFHFEISQSANIMMVDAYRFSMWELPVLLKYTFFIEKIYKIYHPNICSVHICWMDIRQSVFSIHKVAKLSKKFFSHRVSSFSAFAHLV